MTDNSKQAEELSDQDLDQVKGAGTTAKTENICSSGHSTTVIGGTGGKATVAGDFGPVTSK